MRHVDRATHERKRAKRPQTTALAFPPHMEEDEPTAEELKKRVDERVEEDERRADKARYLKEKLDEREQSEREAGLTDEE